MSETTKWKWILSNTFNANNTLVSLLTILFFITALVLFFWFVISDQLKIIILEKLEIIKIYSDNDKNFKNVLKDMVNKQELDENNYRQEINNRNEQNIKTFAEMLIWWFVVVIVCVVANILYITILRKPFDKADIVLVVFVLSAFVAEIIFYLVIIREWKFIGDNEIIKELIK